MIKENNISDNFVTDASIELSNAEMEQVVGGETGWYYLGQAYGHVENALSDFWTRCKYNL